MSTKLNLPPDGKLRALTVREPFANLIVKGFKPIENRLMPFPKSFGMPCTIAIHAGTDDSTIADDLWDVCGDPVIDASYTNPNYAFHTDGRENFYGGVIVGLVDVVACVDISQCIDSDDSIRELIDDAHPWPPGVQNPQALRSDWANGPMCLILDNPRRFRTSVVCRGQQNYWTVPDDKMKLVRESMQDLLLNPLDLPNKPVGGVAKWLGRRKKQTA